jgi:SAM-dependent methyltransferase
MNASTLDPIWEQRYLSGHAERWPWDHVVTFVYRHMPRDRPRVQITVMEVGFGTANNLWFAAREGFGVMGVEGSAAGVATARARFEAEGLTGDLRVGDFTALPFADESADLAIDRAALTCVSRTSAHRAVAEIRRVLRPGGRFLFNVYADTHTSATSGLPGEDGLRKDIDAGMLIGAGQLCFWSEAQVRALFADWTLLSLEYVVRTELSGADPTVHSEWRVVAERSP